MVNINDGQFTYEGSIICPPCAAVCSDNMECSTQISRMYQDLSNVSLVTILVALLKTILSLEDH